MTRGMLFSQMEPPRGWEADFNDWYETEHIPARMALDGFECATRYRAVRGTPAYLAVYELSDLAVLSSEVYRRIKEQPSERTERMLSNVHGFTRFTCELVADRGSDARGRYLSAVAFEVPEPDRASFDDWYESEHVPALLRADDWLRVRRLFVRSGSGAPWSHIALHELASLEVMDSPERAAARVGPKRDALAGRAWFERSGRWLYEAVSRHR
ncbi:MAG: hypothetical protein ACRDRN_20960 [Sciscionella sp.]